MVFILLHLSTSSLLGQIYRFGPVFAPHFKCTSAISTFWLLTPRLFDLVNSCAAPLSTKQSLFCEILFLYTSNNKMDTITIEWWWILQKGTSLLNNSQRTQSCELPPLVYFYDTDIKGKVTNLLLRYIGVRKIFNQFSWNWHGTLTSLFLKRRKHD